MHFPYKIITISMLGAVFSHAASLFTVSDETEESIPLRWSIGMNLIWDDNSVPTDVNSSETMSFNATVGLTYSQVTPQTTWDLYASMGMVYYFDEPSTGASDDTFGQTRLGLNLNHRFSERLRYRSSNSLSFELEPDYTYGFATNREVGQYLFWNTDNSIGFRWTDRFGTYTGLSLSGLTYSDLPSNDRFTWTAYNQFRYQLSPQTVLTSSYRFSQTTASGLASDSNSQFFLVGFEHRFSPNTVAILNAGAQMRDADQDDSTVSSPYFEFNIRSRVNQYFSVKAFSRYGIEDYDTVQTVGVTPVEYDGRLTLRVGTGADYQISPKISLSAGCDLINTSFEDGRTIPGGASVGNQNEFLTNLYIGFSFEFTDNLFGNLAFNHTISDSDFALRDYDRNRVSLGLRAEF